MITQTNDDIRELMLRCDTPIDFLFDATMPSDIVSGICAKNFLEDPFFGRIAGPIRQVNKKEIRMAQEVRNTVKKAAPFTTCNAEATESCPPKDGLADKIVEATYIRQTCSLDHCDLAEMSDLLERAGSSSEKSMIINQLVDSTEDIINNFVDQKEFAIKQAIYSGILTGSVEGEAWTNAGPQTVVFQTTNVAQEDFTAGTGAYASTASPAAWVAGGGADVYKDLVGLNKAYFDGCSGCNLDYIAANKETVCRMIEVARESGVLCCETETEFLMIQFSVRSGELFQMPIPGFPPILVVDGQYQDMAGNVVKWIPDGSLILVSDCADDAVAIVDAKNMDKPCDQNGRTKAIPGGYNVGSVVTSECRPNPFRVDVTHSWSGMMWITNPNAFVHVKAF